MAFALTGSYIPVWMITKESKKQGTKAIIEVLKGWGTLVRFPDWAFEQTAVLYLEKVNFEGA